jgi:hypothetical protein
MGEGKSKKNKEERDMKKILVLVAVLAVSTIACQAFNDSYGEDTVTAGGGTEEVQSQGGGGETVLGDFSADKTECVAVEGVKIVKAEEAGKVKETVLNTAEEDAKLSTAAEQIGAFTTKISVLNGEEEAVSFTLKQTDADKFDVCNVSYKDMAVKGGEVTIDTFNTDKVNAGTFKFEFTAAAAEEAVEPSAIKMMTAIVKAAEDVVEEVTVVEGSYFTDATVDKVTKVEEEKKE